MIFLTHLSGSLVTCAPGARARARSLPVPRLELPTTFIQSRPIGLHCRYSQFKVMHMALTRLVGKVALPPFPGRSCRVDKRRAMLETYMKRGLADQSICAAAPFHAFMQVSGTGACPCASWTGLWCTGAPLPPAQSFFFSMSDSARTAQLQLNTVAKGHSKPQFLHDRLSGKVVPPFAAMVATAELHIQRSLVFSGATTTVLDVGASDGLATIVACRESKVRGRAHHRCGVR